MSSALQAVPARPAATVLLLRDGTAGLEVFLQRRDSAMAFAPGITAFPGGSVEPGDMAAEAAWAGPEPAWWAGRLGCDPELARALVNAAVRETFEECGVLLAGPGPAELVADTVTLLAARAELETGARSLSAVLHAAGLTLRADLLAPWARWVTPEGLPRRFDAWFFLAAMPPGQLADGATVEADAVGWYRPEQALLDSQDGTTTLLPPTWAALRELADFGDVAGALAASEARRIEPLMPLIRRDGDRRVLVLPDGTEFPTPPGPATPPGPRAAP